MVSFDEEVFVLFDLGVGGGSVGDIVCGVFSAEKFVFYCFWVCGALHNK